MNLPQPSADALDQSARLLALVHAEVAAAGGWLPFSRYMELALYAPGLGYYSGGARKFGPGGDFITAPELTPLFGQALAAQVEQVMRASAAHVIEAGAGTGLLAADLLLDLERRGCLPERYDILELSGELRARQGETLARKVPHLAARVRWLDALPLWHLVPQALFVHAGIRPGVDLARQTEHDLVWIRKGFLDDASDHGLLVVHGHSPVKQVTHFGNRLAIDTGAAYGGPLSVVVFDETGLHLLTEAGREPIPAP